MGCITKDLTVVAQRSTRRSERRTAQDALTGTASGTPKIRLATISAKSQRADRGTPSVRLSVCRGSPPSTGSSSPHFHAKYGEYLAQIAIATGEVLNGELPRRARALVDEWTELHRDELMVDWELAVRQEPLQRIEPLP